MNANPGGGNVVTCPNCRQAYPVRLEQIIDVGRDPGAKARFLSGQTNVGLCPHCGYRVALATPLLYHDPEKELFLVYVPMELGLGKEDQERLIGQMVKAVMDSTPAEQRRGYMFQPKPVLSLQGLVEAVLGADGVTPEMLEAQREKMRLVETFLQTDEEQLADLVAQHDDQIDMEFLEIITLAAENARQAGREDMAQHALHIRDRLMALSTAGKEAQQELAAQEQAIEEVIEQLQALGDRPTANDFMNLVIGLADDDRKLQAVVGLQYPVFDYGFFQALSERIEAAAGEERARLEGLRDRLVELTDMIKRQQETAARAAAVLLGDIVNSEDIEAAVRGNIPYIDDTFMMVLAANLKASEDRNDLVASARLKQVKDAIDKIMQESIPPEVQFASRLLQAESLEAAQELLNSEGAQHRDALVPILDAVLRDISERGADPELVEHVKNLRAMAAQFAG
ncbi:MAG: CpXC domain-containing protein [Anaerolineae bacterium]